MSKEKHAKAAPSHDGYAAAQAFAAKANDLDVLREAVVDTAALSAGLWLSYLSVLLYLLVAAGAVTHRDLLFESPVKLPFLNVELPLLGFFALGPLLFLIVHAYTLLHFVVLAGKVGTYDIALRAQVPDGETRAQLRRQLPGNIFVQFLAGPAEVRAGVVGFLLRLIAQISLVVLPIALLVFFELQFLPYHDAAISWWQRLAVVVDLVLLWLLWPSVAQGRATKITWPFLRRRKIVLLALLSLAPLLLVFTIATFPGEWMEDNLPYVGFIPSWDQEFQEWDYISLHAFLVAGRIDFITHKPKSLWSNVIVLPGLDLSQDPRFDTSAKVAAAETTISLRGRRLEGAVFVGARLPKADFTGAQLQGISLIDADLHEAKFFCDRGDWTARDPDDNFGASTCTQMQHAHLDRADLRGASMMSASLQSASLSGAKLEGALIYSAKLSGANLSQAEMQGAGLSGATLVGADVSNTDLRGADFENADLRAANLANARLDSANLSGANLRGANLLGASLVDASLAYACAWRISGPTASSITGVWFTPSRSDSRSRACALSQKEYSALRAELEDQISDDFLRGLILKKIEILDPARKINVENDLAQSLASLEKKSPIAEVYRQAIENDFTKLGCEAGNAPYVASGLISEMSSMNAERDDTFPQAAAAFSDETHCPGAVGLTDADKATLASLTKSRTIAPAPASIPAPK